MVISVLLLSFGTFGVVAALRNLSFLYLLHFHISISAPFRAVSWLFRAPSFGDCASNTNTSEPLLVPLREFDLIVTEYGSSALHLYLYSFLSLHFRTFNARYLRTFFATRSL